MPTLKLKKIFTSIIDVFSFHRTPFSQQPFNLKHKTNLSLEKQKELESLYRQLLNNKVLIASGKIQFVGLENVKKKMGKKWAGLSSFVYEITEEIINKHTEKTDLFLGHRDDSYVIIFSKASTDEAKIKMNAITEEIRQRLFTLDDEQLKKIEIKHTVQHIKTKSFLESQFPVIEEPNHSSNSFFRPKAKKISALYSDKIAVSAEPYKATATPNTAAAIIIENLNYIYIPLWEVKRAALTTYICLPTFTQTEKKSFFAYHELYLGKSKEQWLYLDIKTLEHTIAEISQMLEDGRKLYIGCPVRYDTLYDFKTYEIYKNICEKIPEKFREFLNFIVINSENALPAKDTYWFVKPLKAFCYDMFVEVPLKNDTNFQFLKASGVENVGIHLNHSQVSEQESINISNNFSSKAKYFKIQKTFALDVSTLSATTSLVCAGFDYIGGSAIHEDVAKPDTIHRYRYEDLLGEMIKSIS